MRFREALTALFLACLLAPCSAAPKDRASSRRNLEDPRPLVERGAPSSLSQAAPLLAADPEKNQALAAAGAALFRALYPDLEAPPFPPAVSDHAYTGVLKEAEGGVYLPPPARSKDFLEYVLPFLACYGAGPGDRRPPDAAQLRGTLPNLDRAAQLNAASVLPPFFRGFVYENTGDLPRAEGAYQKALEIAGDCYPAELGLARVLIQRGRDGEALTRLSGLAERYPGNREIPRRLARLYAERRDWARADPLIAGILQRDGRDGEFLLLRARSFVEQKLYQRAQAPLDSFASIDAGSREYLFLRARIQAEGFHSREGALGYLRPLLRAHPEDTEIAVYTAALLMDSPRAEDEAEGRAILDRLLQAPGARVEALALALEDSVRRESWQDAKGYLDKLLPLRRESGDLFNACRVERGLGNYAAALSYARELYGRDSSSEDAVSVFITALIDTGRNAEAARIIDQRLAAVPGGAVKSRYYYFRSQIRGNEEAVMNDLRSSLFEDPRNVDALIAMFEVYHRRRDQRRAAYYLKQALALSPNNPQLKRYEEEYSSRP
ncbi:MAG: hypothetical protein LBG84_05565 [Treponema sp.]|jgi:tetratricopeptide (TPR) repeat protein|nr:hypothetical protein [Treponema sp.]